MCMCLSVWFLCVCVCVCITLSIMVRLLPALVGNSVIGVGIPCALITPGSLALFLKWKVCHCLLARSLNWRFVIVCLLVRYLNWRVCHCLFVSSVKVVHQVCDSIKDFYTSRGCKPADVPSV